MGLSVKSRQQSAHRMIQRYGGDTPLGYLDRGGTTRAATMCRMDYTPKANGVALDRVSKIRISTIGLATPPDFELDEILYAGERYRILDEPTGPRLGAAFVYYDCNVVYIKVEP
jgi:hypothetical protein